MKKKKLSRRDAKLLPPSPIEMRRDPNLIPAIVGDACPKKLEFGEHVEPACEGPSFKACCLSCAVQLPTQGVLEDHLQSGSRHVIARVCVIHGAEEWI